MRASGRKDVLEERCHLSFLRCGKALQRRGVDSPSENGLNFKHLYESNCGGSFLLKRLIFRYRRDAKFQFIMIQSTPEYSCCSCIEIKIVWCGKVRYKFAVKVVYRCHNILLLNCLDIQEPLSLYFTINKSVLINSIISIDILHKGANLFLKMEGVIDDEVQ